MPEKKTANRGRPGVTHCGRHLTYKTRCRRKPGHEGDCSNTPDPR